jgi:hypothetical protein
MKRPRKATAVTAANRRAINDAAWAHALRHESFGYAEISVDLNITLEQATRIVRAWVKEGAVTSLPPATSNRHLYAARAEFVRPKPRRLRSAEENLWTAMRRLRSFTPTDLAAHATTDTVEVLPVKAGDYCRSLLAAGYLRVARKAQPSVQREAIYTLARETGPRPPHERRVRAVVDPNTDEVHLLGGIE